MTPIDNPCYGCNKRGPYCHCEGVCEDYGRYKGYRAFISQNRTQANENGRIFAKRTRVKSKFGFGSRSY